MILAPAPQTYQHSRIHKVLWRNDIGPGAFVLGIERKNLEFTPGQYVSVACAGSLQAREYSLYSGVKDDSLEILVRRVTGGMVSARLGSLTTGDAVQVDGPFGEFCLPAFHPADKKVVMVATGTGIAPFRSIIRSGTGLGVQVLHGIRNLNEAWGHDDFAPGSIQLCVSAEPGSHYQGRCTAWLREHGVDTQALWMLCGNCDMVYETWDILASAGVPPGRIRVEVFF